MKWTISYENEMIEGNSFNEVFNEICNRETLIKSLFSGVTYVGYREGKRLLECGTWYIKDKQLMYQAISKQFKNKDGEVE